MKNILVIIIFLSLSVTAKAAGSWGDFVADDSFAQSQDQAQDQLISAEIDDEVQSASGLKISDEHKTAKSEVVEKPLTEEMAIADLGKEIDNAEAKAYEAEVDAQKVAKVELEKKQKLQKQLKALKVSKKAKTLSSKNKPAKYVYRSAKVRQSWTVNL